MATLEEDIQALIESGSETARVIADKAGEFFTEGVDYTQENMGRFFESLRDSIPAEDLAAWRDRFMEAPVDTLGEAFTSLRDGVADMAADTPGAIERFASGTAEFLGNVTRTVPGAAGALAATLGIFSVAFGMTGATSLWSLNGLFTAACAIGISMVVAPAAAVAVNNWWYSGNDDDRRAGAEGESPTVDPRQAGLAVEPERAAEQGVDLAALVEGEVLSEAARYPVTFAAVDSVRANIPAGPQSGQTLSA